MTARRPEQNQPDSKISGLDRVASAGSEGHSSEHARSECFQPPQSATKNSSQGIVSGQCVTKNAGVGESAQTTEPRVLLVSPLQVTPDWAGSPYKGKLENTASTSSTSFPARFDFLSNQRIVNDPASASFHFSDTSKFSDPVPVAYDEHRFGQKPNYDIPRPGAEYEALATLADQRITNQNDRAKFETSLSWFHERAFYQKLSPDEELNTYRQLSRLLTNTSNAGVNTDQLSSLAQQVIKQAAHPSLSYQGDHNTCGAVETWLYANNPSAVAKLVSDVALTGEYQAADGTSVKIDPHRIEADETHGPPSKVRSYASQLFQATAINLLVTKNPANSNSPLVRDEDIGHAEMRYVEEKYSDTWLYRRNGPSSGERRGEFKGVRLDRIPLIGELILGKHEPNTLLPTLSGDNYIGFTSEQELRDGLAYAKREGKLPLRIGMDSRMQPLAYDMMDQPGIGAHVVTITDFQDEPSPRVLIHNPWSDKSPEHDRLLPVGLHDLYLNSLTPEDQINELKKDIDAARARGKRDYAKEFDSLRVQTMYGKDKPTYEQLDRMTDLMVDLKDHWNTNPSAHQRREESKAVAVLIRDAEYPTSDILTAKAVRLGLTKAPELVEEGRKLGVYFPVSQKTD